MLQGSTSGSDISYEVKTFYYLFAPLLCFFAHFEVLFEIKLKKIKLANCLLCLHWFWAFGKRSLYTSFPLYAVICGRSQETAIAPF